MTPRSGILGQIPGISGQMPGNLDQIPGILDQKFEVKQSGSGSEIFSANTTLLGSTTVAELRTLANSGHFSLLVLCLPVAPRKACGARLLQLEPPHEGGWSAVVCSPSAAPLSCINRTERTGS